MKTILCISIVLLSCARVLSQGQELEQLRLDLEKLAQFKLMLSEMKSGYQTLLNSYNSVRDAGKANFHLHQSYLDGLLMVSASVKQDPGIQRIYSGQRQLTMDCQTLIARLRSSKVFTPGELTGIAANSSKLLDAAAADGDLLSQVLTAGALRMSDGERSNVVRQIDQSVQQQLAKLKSLSDVCNRTLLQRLQQKRDLEAIRRLGNF